MKLKSLLLSLAVVGSMTASADEVQLLSITPAAGTALETPGLDSGREYTFSTNIDAQIGYADIMWHDVTGDPEEPEYISSTYAYHTVGENTPVTFTSYDAYSPMYAGHDYRMTVTLYDKENPPYERTELGTFTVMYKGATTGYQYSDIKATSVSPDPATYVIEDVAEAHFTVSFSGAVEIDTDRSNISHGPMGVQAYASITPNDDKTEWTFVIPEDELAEREIACFILAKDADGRTVQGNEDMEQYQNGEGDGAGFMFSYVSQIAGEALVVTPEGGKVDELKSFTATSEKGFAVMEPSWTAYPYLMKDKELVYKFNLETDMEKDGEGKMVLTIPEDKVPNVNGRYELIFPFGCFMFQVSVTDQGGTASKYTVISYTLGEEPTGDVTLDLNPESITPAEGDVTEIKTVDIHFAEDVNLMLYDAYILNDKGEEVAKADINFDDDFDNLKDYHVTFEPAITEAGAYTLYIPKETFGNQTYADSNATMGSANAEIRVAYEIKAASVDSFTADYVNGNVYNMTGVCVLRNATSADIKTLDKGIYVVNGKKVVVL